MVGRSVGRTDGRWRIKYVRDAGQAFSIGRVVPQPLTCVYEVSV